MSAPDRDYSAFTLVFEGDLRAFSGNPLNTETPFGTPVAVGFGNAFDTIEELHASCVSDGNTQCEDRVSGLSAEGIPARCHEVADVQLSSSKARIEELEAENGKMDVVIAQQCQRADKWKSRAKIAEGYRISALRLAERAQAAESRLSEMKTALASVKAEIQMAAWGMKAGSLARAELERALVSLRSKGETGDAS